MMDFITIIIILIVVFLLSRELVTWYWKLNDITDLLKKIERNTRKEDGENINIDKDDTLEEKELENKSKTKQFIDDLTEF